VTREEAEALGRRYLAAGGRWRAGMLAVDGRRVVAVPGLPVEHADAIRAMFPRVRLDAGRGIVLWVGAALDADSMDRGECSAALLPSPDFRDAATLGCLLVEARERLGDPLLYTEPAPGEESGDADWWRACVPLRHGRRVVSEGPAEAEALVAAIKAAKGMGK
jgi:hypothetical protein